MTKRQNYNKFYKREHTALLARALIFAKGINPLKFARATIPIGRTECGSKPNTAEFKQIIQLAKMRRLCIKYQTQVMQQKSKKTTTKLDTLSQNRLVGQQQHFICQCKISLCPINKQLYCSYISIRTTHTPLSQHKAILKSWQYYVSP